MSPVTLVSGVDRGECAPAHQVISGIDAERLADAGKDKRRVVGKLEVALHMRWGNRRALATERG